MAPNVFDTPSRDYVNTILTILTERKAQIEEKMLPSGDRSLYTFKGFLQALKEIAEGAIEGKYFYVGSGARTNRVNRKRGLVNIAAFLAHTKTVAVGDNICDEQNVDGIEGKFPLSNACGQYGDSYQNYRCSIEETFMECPPDPSLQMSAVAPVGSASIVVGGAVTTPPPFFCGPREFFPFVGYYDSVSRTVQNNAPYANRAGRTDVQSCCWVSL